MTATPTPAPLLEDAPIHAWCIESLDSADWCWSASIEGVKLNAELLDPGCTPSEPFAVVRKSVHDERIARLIAHMDAQALLLADAERDAERYRWLRDSQESDWAICEWANDHDGTGFYRDARNAEIVEAAIDAAMASEKAS